VSEHYTRNTESALRYCDRCGRVTKHAVSDGRLGRCTEHDAPHLSQRQARDRARREAEAAQLALKFEGREPGEER